MRFARRALTLTLAGAVGLGLAAALPASASSASAAATPGWRVVSKLGPSESDWVTSLTAVSATDAWSTWSAAGNKDVEHWNGRSWQRVSVPANLASRVAGAPIGASSASDVWVFGAVGSVIRYNGGKWRVQTIPKWAVHSNLGGDISVTPAVFSPTNVWAFSLGWDAPTKPDHYAAHYNGHVWTKVEMPAVPYTVSVVSPTDIWAAGPSPQNISKWVLMHWNGKTWTTPPMPRASVPKGDTAQFSGLLGVGQTDAWMMANISTSSLVPAKTELLHWNGKSWSNVAIKYPTTTMQIASDGHGGLWAAAQGTGPAYAEHFYHLSDGRWSEYAVPDAVDIQPPGLTWIPGTRSVWATGDLIGKNVVYGATLKYGA
jgi:hypothetical protein